MTFAGRRSGVRSAERPSETLRDLGRLERVDLLGVRPVFLLRGEWRGIRLAFFLVGDDLSRDALLLASSAVVEDTKSPEGGALRGVWV